MNINPLVSSDDDIDIRKIQIQVYPDNRLADVVSMPSHFRVIGKGTDAIVFQRIHEHCFVFKVFAPETLDKLAAESRAYQKLGDSPYFCRYYETGSYYLKLSYEAGLTLYDCFIQGVEIPAQVIEDVDAAIVYARSKGLNPRDIHLKNIILQKNRGKLLDIAEYLNLGNDLRWEHFKEGYKQYYSYIKGKPIPIWLIETVKQLYLSSEQDYQKVIDQVLQLWKRI